MATITKDQMLQRKYADPTYYPYGFSRSGDFSIKESQLLSDYGCLISALLTGQVTAETEEDQQLLAVARGEQAPCTPVEKVWFKYQQRIHRPRYGSIYGSKTRTDSDGSDIIDDDEPLELDIS
ncbi:UPF0438 protein [Saliniradius amylolyticus]|uniref:Macrodomain Ori protein n=1 Tax=Saliniradius amylolyticus TaxID=2183582 RepID=A0A2S2E6E8_9ALTE|nr:DUF413 domain-containing protein [Saliniradius amylolyticus]AWL13236.1 UPF0438 protein [Saliniradius amylolyticus]